MNVLVVADQFPGHDLGFQKSGHAQYLGSILAHFSARGDDVTLISFQPKVDFIALSLTSLDFRVAGPSFAQVRGTLIVRSPAAIRTLLVWTIFGRLPQAWKAAADKIRRRIRRARGAVHHLGRFLDPTEIAYVRQFVSVANPDLIVYDSIFSSCGRLAACDHWLIAHEVKHQRTRSFADQNIDVSASAVSEADESLILAQADTVLAIQWDDAEVLRRMAPGARVIVVPAAIPAAISPLASRPIAGRCLFVGSGSFHNYDGIAWFLRDCWPGVRARVPSARLDIYGSVCFRIADVPPGVVLHGVVDDLASAYAEAAVTIVPLRIGSGLKVKLIEAFAHGQAVLTTPIGAQGLMGFVPRPFEVAEVGDAFTTALVALLDAPLRQDQLRSAARECAVRFTPAAAFADIDAALAATTTVCA